MDEIIYLIRKQGALKVENKADALIILEAAKQQGFTFEIKKQGWNFLIIDTDN